ATPLPDPNWFFAALSFLPALEPRDAHDQLLTRVAHLESEIQTYRQGLSSLTPRGRPLNLIEMEYALALRVEELCWVKRIIDELSSGKLKWNPKMLQMHAAHLFSARLPQNESNKT